MHSRQETTNFLQEFEKGFDPIKPELSTVPVRILGYGEISTVIAFELPELKDMAFKRLPLFSCEKEAEDYCALYLEYNGLLASLGIDTPPSNAYAVKGHRGLHVAYLSQKRLDGGSIGNKALHNRPDAEIETLFGLVLDKMLALWQHNQQHPELQLGLDSQISNWAIKYFTPDTPITGETELYFIDTSTPFIRKDGTEQMNPLLFLQSAPKPMRWVLRKFFLQDIMDRYYDFRLVAIDLLANLFKEQCPDLIDTLIGVVNTKGGEFLFGKALEYQEIERYYREDKFIWKLFLSARRADRFIQTQLLGNRYEFTLPGKIRR
jgi:hypothetical protein